MGGGEMAAVNLFLADAVSFDMRRHGHCVGAVRPGIGPVTPADSPV